MIYARRDIASKTTKGPLLPIAGDQRIVDYRYIDDRVFMPKRKLIALPSAAFQSLLGPGTLYSSIQTLVDAKLIEETEPREDVKLGHERRRYYRLTSAGRKLARLEAERLADLLRLARAKKILRGEYV